MISEKNKKRRSAHGICLHFLVEFFLKWAIKNPKTGVLKEAMGPTEALSEGHEKNPDYGLQCTSETKLTKSEPVSK